MSYQDTRWGGESYPSAEEQLLYSTGPADKATNNLDISNNYVALFLRWD